MIVRRNELLEIRLGDPVKHWYIFIQVVYLTCIWIWRSWLILAVCTEYVICVLHTVLHKESPSPFSRHIHVESWVKMVINSWTHILKYLNCVHTPPFVCTLMQTSPSRALPGHLLCVINVFRWRGIWQGWPICSGEVSRSWLDDSVTQGYTNLSSKCGLIELEI